MNKTAQLLIMTAAMCWGLIGIFSRQLVAAGFAFVEIGVARCLITAVCLFAYLLMTDRKKIKINLGDIKYFVCIGGFGIAIFNVFYFRTMEMITLSATTILLYTSPFIVMIISALAFKDKITRYKVAALIIAFVGCLMTLGITGGDMDINLAGVLSGLASAFCFSQYTIFGKIALRKYSPVTISAYACVIAFIFLIPFCDVGKMIALMSESSVNVMNLFILGFFLTLVPFVCYTNGLNKIEASRAIIIAFFEIPTAAMVGIIVFEEMLTLVKVAGIALVFVSLFVLNINGK